MPIRKLTKNKDGFASLLEVVITSVIFVTSAFAIFSTISMLRPQGVISKQKLEAAYIGKRVIDELRGYVDSRVWDDPTGQLAVGQTYQQTIGDYRVDYWFTDVPGMDGNLRQMDMTVFYVGP